MCIVCIVCKNVQCHQSVELHLKKLLLVFSILLWCINAYKCIL